MHFTRRKLAVESASELKACPIDTVKPYALMHAPAYVFMKRNQKFIAVKAPMDFFTPEELERLLAFEMLFFPSFVDKVAPYRDAARALRALLSWKPVAPDALTASSGAVVLAPAPYEISDAVVRIVGPLWTVGCTVEPFFVAVFANELCDVMASPALKSYHDEDVTRFETALLRSAWMVFLALHLGYCNLAFLNRLHERAFEASFKRENPFRDSPELDELYQLVSVTIEGVETKAVEGTFFTARPERVAQKIRSRLERVERELIKAGAAPATIFGEAGFADG